ncbi:MAG: glycoside hydrolase family 5 protein [Treponema sp.]|jgi:endoglucanase|nr:glycoside hydrolase family 5 protein [Treponema sp.]
MKRAVFGNHLARSAVYTLLAVCALVTGCYRDTRLSVDKNGKTVVERYGQLQVKGTQLLNANGKPVQLRGVSSFALQYGAKYANEIVIGWLRDDWNIQVWRAALELLDGGYISRPALKKAVDDSVDAAIKLGIYVIIDWHVHQDGNPQRFEDNAAEFFDEMSKKYGEYPNVIYEICNEPNGEDVTWDEVVKPYAERIISVIRANDPDNIIVVGTPRWSQMVDAASENPIADYSNIMYTLHFYAGTHGESLREQARVAIKNGLPLFVTECGTSKASGGEGVFEPEFLEWASFMQKNNISWVNWSLTNKGEDSGILILNADREGKGHWTENQLSQSGKFIRSILRNEIKIK